MPNIAVLAAYTPADFTADLATGDILTWVGAGAGAAIVVALALIGIRRGVATFKSIAR